MTATRPTPSRPLKPDFPGACIKNAKTGAVPFGDAVAILRAWRKRHPEALQLDGHPSGRNNLKAWLHVKLDGFSSPRHDFRAKHSHELITGNFYNGTWNLHGDAKAAAIDRLLLLCADGADPVDFLIPSATHEGKAEHHGDQNPKFTIASTGASSAEDLFLYQS
jgi:hypothetical protein